MADLPRIPWDALTFVATVVLIWIALAERRHDRRATVTSVVGATSASSWRTRLRDLPKRRILAGIGAFVFFILTLILMIYPPAGTLETHVATAYWYRTELDELRRLIAKYHSLTQNELKNYLENRGQTPPSSDNDIGGLEANIKEMVRNDFGVELDLSEHLQFDNNRYYPAPNVDQIIKDYDKEQYRRLYDQYSQADYTLNQVVSAYQRQIWGQEDYVKKYVQRPSGCHYTQNGNFGCP